MEETYYKSSGKAPIGGVLFAIIAGVCATVILASYILLCSGLYQLYILTF